MNPIRQPAIALAFAAAICCGPAYAGTEDEVRAVFERFVQAQNTHDAKAVEGLLLDSTQFLWITRGTAIWGRDAALQRFTQLYQGTWKLEPDWAGLRIVPVGAEVAQLHVPVNFTTGAAGQPPTVARMYLNQTLLKTAAGWRVATILPVPAPAP